MFEKKERNSYFCEKFSIKVVGCGFISPSPNTKSPATDVCLLRERRKLFYDSFYALGASQNFLSLWTLP